MGTSISLGLLVCFNACQLLNPCPFPIKVLMITALKASETAYGNQGFHPLFKNRGIIFVCYRETGIVHYDWQSLKKKNALHTDRTSPAFRNEDSPDGCL